VTSTQIGRKGVNARGGGNNELQYYITNNVQVKDGLLFIEARKQRYTGPEGTRDYSSSRIRTRHKADWKYGRFVIRAKLPKGDRRFLYRLHLGV
jgi:beta-glucanase (GH16 family)